MNSISRGALDDALTNASGYPQRDLTQPIEDCVACDGTGQTAMVYDGVVGIETCDICGGSGVDR